MDVLYRYIFTVIWFFIGRPWSSLYTEGMKKKSLGNNPLKINIDNSGEGKETQNQNQRTTMTVNWENIFGNKINPL